MFCLTATCFMNLDHFLYMHCKEDNDVVFIGLTDKWFFLFFVKAPLSSGGLFQGKR